MLHFFLFCNVSPWPPISCWISISYNWGKKNTIGPYTICFCPLPYCENPILSPFQKLHPPFSPCSPTSSPQSYSFPSPTPLLFLPSSFTSLPMPNPSCLSFPNSSKVPFFPLICVQWNRDSVYIFSWKNRQWNCDYIFYFFCFRKSQRRTLQNGDSIVQS